MALSGHCHRVELFLSLLKLPYELVDVDMAAGEHKSPAFLAKNAFGQVPVIEDGVARAPEGKVSLGPYPSVRSWLARIEAWPRFVPMPRSAVGLAC